MPAAASTAAVSSPTVVPRAGRSGAGRVPGQSEKARTTRSFPATGSATTCEKSFSTRNGSASSPARGSTRQAGTPRVASSATQASTGRSFRTPVRLRQGRVQERAGVHDHRGGEGEVGQGAARGRHPDREEVRPQSLPVDPSRM
jgi:hypothetical protein